MDKNFLFSVIVPVFNVKDYLDECLTSVIDQTIGFDCIQLILVNDGSSDESGEICKRYAKEHPDNIIYIEQLNSGVAAARNKGLELARGELITFLDGDDKWSVDAFENVCNACISHRDIAVFSCKMVFFDGDNSEHQLNYKYTEDRIIDIRKDYNFPQLSSSSVFIRGDIANKYRFAEGLKYSEDFRFINEIILDHPRMMLLKDPVYWYRRRAAGDSAIQRSVGDPDYYIPACSMVYRYLFDMSREKYGSVLRYIQFCVMYDLRWRLKIPLNETGLSKTDSGKYCDIVISLLQEIDDDIIIEQKRIALALQIYALELKHGRPVTDKLTVSETGVISYDSIALIDLSKLPLIRIDLIRLNEDSIAVHGQIIPPLVDDRLKFIYYLNGVPHEIDPVPSDNNVKTYWHGTLKSNQDFTIRESIDYSKLNELSFIVSFDRKEFVTAPKYSASSGLEKKSDEYTDGRHSAFRNGSLLCFRQRCFTDCIARKIRAFLSL